MALKFSLRQHKHPITCLLLTNTLYSADNSGTIIQWRLEDRRPLKQIQTQPVVNMMEHQDNLFVQLRNGWILIYQDLEVVGKIQCAELTFCRFKIREDRMLYCRKDPSVVDLMDMRSNDLLMTKGTEDGVCMSMFLGDKVCVGYEDGSLLVDDELLFLFKHPVLSVDQRDKTIAATSAGGELLISSDQQRVVKFPSGLSFCKIHPERDLILVGSWDGSIYLVPFSGKTQILREHSKSVVDGLWTPTGFITCSEDMRISVWTL